MDNEERLDEALKKSGLTITVERYFFIEGFRARVNGIEKPLNIRAWNQEFIDAGWMAGGVE